MKLLNRRKENIKVSAEIDARAKADYDAAVAEAAEAGYEVDIARVIEAALRAAARNVRAALRKTARTQADATGVARSEDADA